MKNKKLLMDLPGHADEASTCIFNTYIDMCMYISTCVAGGVYPYSPLSLSLSLFPSYNDNH